MTHLDLDYAENFNDSFLDYNYSAIIPINVAPKKPCFSRAECGALVVIDTLILVLGLCGNGLVIWIAGFKAKRTVNTTWYQSLALVDFLYCALLPFSITQTATSAWLFGPFMCKMTSFSMFLNMFTSIFIMVLISIDRCVVVVWPVWAQNHRTPRKAAVAVITVWAICVALSIPSLLFRKVTTTGQIQRCFNDFTLPNSRVNTPVVRFVFGFVLPLIVITVCYSLLLLKLKAKKMATSAKPFKVTTALVVTFLVSWLPYHIFILLEIDYLAYDFVRTGLKISVTLASANSCMNPFLYAFMGKDFKQKFLSSIFTKIKNAFDEEEICDTGMTQSSSKGSSTV